MPGLQVILIRGWLAMAVVFSKNNCLDGYIHNARYLSALKLNYHFFLFSFFFRAGRG